MEDIIEVMDFENTYAWKNTYEKRFSDVWGLDEVKARLLSLSSAADSKYGALLFGHPGTGKTMLAMALANELEVNIAVVSEAELCRADKKERLKRLFYEARHLDRAVVVLDGADEILPAAPSTPELVAEIASEMALCEGRVILVATTNKPWNIDPTALSELFTTRLYVENPARDIRLAMLEDNLEKLIGGGLLTRADNVDLADVLDATEGYSVWNMECLMKAAGTAAVMRYVTEMVKEVDASLYLKEAAGYAPSLTEDDLDRMRLWLESES